MIRPFTILCFLLACGSGLYLYQSKHRAQMLDREIERTVHATEALRDQTRLLGAEWMLLNDPERLRTLADQFLTLQTVKPVQFTTLADLDHRLPAVRSPDAPLEPVPEPAVMTPMVPPPVAQGASPPAPAAAPPPVVADKAPTEKTAPVQTSPRPAPAPLVAERKVPEHPAPTIARVAATQADPRPTVLASAARPAPPPHIRPTIAPVAATVQDASIPMGSSLGMASRSSLPPPKPVALFQPIDH
jgi:hypothetical protein